MAVDADPGLNKVGGDSLGLLFGPGEGALTFHPAGFRERLAEKVVDERDVDGPFTKRYSGIELPQRG
jgi:hypothetical protein